MTGVCMAQLVRVGLSKMVVWVSPYVSYRIALFVKDGKDGLLKKKKKAKEVGGSSASEDVKALLKASPKDLQGVSICCAPPSPIFFIQTNAGFWEQL